MRVLLTGAAGFLGSHALRHLLVNTDWHIVCPVSFSHKGLPERLTTVVEEHQWERVTVIRCDLAAPINPTTQAQFGDIDYVVNYASESHVDRSISDPVPFVRNNVDLVLSLLEYARVAKPRAFVQISTDEVYGAAPAGYNPAEWDAIIPSNPYSASKAAQEAIAISYWRTYGVPVVVVNCMNLVGEMQDPEKFVSSTIAKVVHGETVQVHASPDGTVGSRFYLHARNLADAVLFLLGRTPALYPDADRPDRWHVVGDREVDNLQMAHLVAGLVGKPLKYELVDCQTSRPGHDLRYALDGGKLQSAGWVAPVSLDEGLKRLVDWTLDNPLWLQ